MCLCSEALSKSESHRSSVKTVARTIRDRIMDRLGLWAGSLSVICVPLRVGQGELAGVWPAVKKGLRQVLVEASRKRTLRPHSDRFKPPFVNYLSANTAKD